MQITRIKSLLQEHQLECTPAREKVLSVCVLNKTPLSVDQVAKYVGTRAHLATIYRTLEKFVAVGLLERIDFQEGKFRYEYMHSHHHHAVCEKCGGVEDLIDTQTEIKALEDRLAEKSGFSVSKHLLELFGICKKCQNLKGHYAK